MVAGYEASAEHLTAVTDCRNLTVAGAAVDASPADDLELSPVAERDASRRLAAFAAGLLLVVGAVAGLHNLYRAGNSAADLLGWTGLLLLGMTALGGGIKLALWGVKPVSTAVFDASTARLSEPAQAVVATLGVIAGAAGIWFTFRGGYTSWWQSITREPGWSLLLGVGQMLVTVLAGASLFTAGKFLVGLAKDTFDSAAEHRHTSIKGGADNTAPHPALVAALIAGGIGLIVMTAWLVPILAPTITGATVLPAVAAIAVVLVVAAGSNLGWWKGLGGLYAWAIDTNQKAGALAGVVALLMFSAGGLGLGWFTPATVPVARAACPPDCGGGGGLDGPPGGGSQFRPPDMPASQPDYSSGNYGRPPLDQNGGISIYNENPATGQVPSQTGGQQSMQEPPFRANPDGSWQARNGEWSPPDYQTASPGLTQGPGRPNPDWPGNQGAQTNPGSQGGNQGAQQPAQQPQQAPQQPSQENPGQQPNQQPQQPDSQRIDELTRQLQDQRRQSGQDRQRIDDLTKQLQQQNKQKQQQTPRFPSKDDKKDRDQAEQQDRDQQSGNNDLAALLIGAASTRRRKQDEQQDPDARALAQDGVQAAQGLPGDIQTYVQSGQQIAQSSGQAAQGFGSAAQAGASLASSAQSGAVNPQDAITVVQGVSQGIQGTADAVSAGSQIVKTAQKEADQVAQAVGDANPQLKPQTEQFTQLNDQASRVTDMVGQGAQLTSQGASMANSASSMNPSAVQPVDFQSGPVPDGTATAMGNEFSKSAQFNPPMQGGGDDPGQPGGSSLQDKLFPTGDDDNVSQPPVGGLTDTLNRMNQPPAPADRFSAAEGYIFNEMDTNRRSQAVNEMKAHLTPPVSVIDGYLAADAWKDQVKAGAAWDHKPKIEQLFGITSPDKLDANHYFQQPGTNRAVLYDIFSNIHYGYIGRIAGFPTETLVWGATRGTAETGQNDDGDLITMRGGAALFEQFGPNMTAAQFHQGLMSIVDQLAAAQQAGQSVPQIKYVP